VHRVLLADDNPINQHVALLLLKRLGVTDVDVASDGKEALEYALFGHYAVILLDIQMPCMTGDEVAAAVRRSLPVPPVLIAMSGDACWDGDPALFDAFLVKPVLLEQLQSVLIAHVPGLFVSRS
jgi:CheY-like chemotaxis protein